MTYQNIKAAANAANNHLSAFNGKPTSDRFSMMRIYDAFAKAAEYTSQNPAARSINFSGETILDGEPRRVRITFSGESVSAPCTVAIALAK